MDPHSIWMGKINHKKLLHFLAMPIIWPGAEIFNQKKSTIVGQLKQPRKFRRSTQEKVLQSEPDPEPHQEQDQFPPSTHSKDTNIVFLKTVDLTRKVYTDQTGRFPVTSIKGKKYILVSYHYESNNIHAKPLKTISGIYLKTAYHKLYSLLTNRGLKPSLHILDNECPNVLKTFTKEVKEKFQLFPPHIHCINSSERAVRSFKEHFISGLACTHNYFPLHIWCRLLPHASLAINLLRQSRMNQILSGYDQLHGGFNYNATPLAPAWNTINYSWKTNCESNLGITWSKMMVSCSLNETLYVTLGPIDQQRFET